MLIPKILGCIRNLQLLWHKKIPLMPLKRQKLFSSRAMTHLLHFSILSVLLQLFRLFRGVQKNS